MTKLRNLSIKAKLILITMLTTVAALILSSTGLLVYDYFSFRQALLQNAVTHAEIIGANSASAILFQDERAAHEVLSALKAETDIVAAAIYTLDGKMFSSYVRADIRNPSFPPPSETETHRFEGRRLSLFHPIRLDGEIAGTLYLRSDLRRWVSRMQRYAGLLGVLTLGATIFSLFLVSKVQKLISEPILHLENVTKRVSAEKNYSIRAARFYEDEVGRLIEGFNVMLSEIQIRDASIQSRTRELENEVKQRQQTERELIAATQAATEANRAKSAFLANMSHELRTPLNAIIGYSEMLEEEASGSENTGFIPDLKKIQIAGKHLLALINDILDLSKIEAGKMELYVEWFEIAPTINELLTTVQPLAAKNGNELRVTLDDSLGAIQTDLTKFRQILYNLLSNACKFTEHGIISLTAARRAKESRDWLHFQVADTGIGISEEQKPSLFKEFSQADNSISREYGGTGLGLAITHRFTQMMQGTISMGSELGKGTTVTVCLPECASAEGAAAPAAGEVLTVLPAGSADTQAQFGTLLVIDDDPAVHELVSRSVSKFGYRVVSAVNGEEGLRMAREALPAAIILDVLMPEMDGWTVLRELKRDASLANIPVHMLTIVDDVSKGYQLGASSYMGKPLDRSRLLALLEAPAARTISNPPGSLEARALYSVLTQSALVINQTDSSQPQGGERP